MTERFRVSRPAAAAAGCLIVLELTGPAKAASSSTYVCADGHVVEVRYPDRSTALITMGRVTFRLVEAPSADGARYVGQGWQWWSKGMRDATLAALPPGRSIAAPGGACHRTS